MRFNIKKHKSNGLDKFFVMSSPPSMKPVILLGIEAVRVARYSLVQF
jgi:hypothetical protein